MPEDLRDLLRRTVEWYEPRPPDPTDAPRRTRARARRGKVAVVLLTFVLAAASFGLVFATFAGRNNPADRPPAPAPSPAYTRQIQGQLSVLQAKLADVHGQLASAAGLVGRLAHRYGEVVRALQAAPNPTQAMRLRADRLQAQLATAKARTKELTAQEQALVKQIKALVARLQEGPSPRSSAQPEAAIDVGLARRICNVQRMSGDVNGDGSVDTVWTGSLVGGEGSCPTEPSRHRVLVIDLDRDGRADVQSTAMDCRTWCVVYALPDLNGDGTAEILVNEGHLAYPASALIGVYELVGRDLVPIRFRDGSNRFTLSDSWQGFAGAYCSSSTFTTWDGWTDGRGALRRVAYRTYAVNISSLGAWRFELVSSRTERTKERPSRTGWASLCGSPTTSFG